MLECKRQNHVQIAQINSGGGGSRYKQIDLIKGIGIILMVCGHVEDNPCVHFIALFHMAIFFIASGYCWNDRNIQDFTAVKKYVIRKFKTLYLPYVLCNGIFLLLTDFFVACHLYSPEQYITGKALAVELLKTLTLGGGLGFAGATWFLRTLLYISVVHAIWSYLTSRLRHGNIYRLVFLLLCAAAAQAVSSFSISLPKGLHNCFAAYLAFVFGIAFQKYDFSRYLRRSPVFIALGCFGALLIFDRLGSIGLGGGIIVNLAFYAVVSVAGWVLLWVIASHMPAFLSGTVEFIGKHTLDIVILHFLAFKPVSAIYILVSHSDVSLLAAYPTIENVPVLWLPYIFAGVGLPLLVGAGARRLKRACMGAFRH